MWFADGGLRGVGYLRGRGGLEKCQGMGLWEVALLSILDDKDLKDDEQLIWFMHILNIDTPFENDELIFLLSIDVVHDFIDATFDQID